MTQHTKTPIEFDGNRFITSPNRGKIMTQIAEMGYHGCRLSEADRANAAFIVKAYNCFDELVAALEKCKLWHQGDKWRHGSQPEFAEWQYHRDVIDAALQKAKREI